MCGGTSVIPTPGKLRQEDSELEASLDYLDLVSKKEKKTHIKHQWLQMSISMEPSHTGP